MTEADVDALPKSLVNLSLLFTADLSDASLGLLPPRLEYLRIPICTSLTNACLPLLPRSLRTLELQKAHRITGADLKLLPNLTSLNLASAAITDDTVANLPHSIISLHLEKNDRLTTKSLVNLPPHLVDLKLTRVLGRISDEDAKNLPRYLHSLNVGYNRHLSDTGIASLPRSLESFTSLWNNQVSLKAVRLLPASLVDLNIGWQSMTDLSMQYLPSRLVSLQLDMPKLSNEGLKDLPKSLTSLVILSASEIDDSGIKNINIPLIHLSLPNSPLTPECLQDLPKTIQNLGLRNSVWNALVADDLLLLPPLLSTLNIDQNIQIQEDAIPQLPRGLTALYASKLVIRKPELLGDLPPSLTKLKAQGHPEIPESMWTYLSPHMEYLYLPGPIHTYDAVPLFPPSLKELNFAISAEKGMGVTEPALWGPLPEHLKLIRVAHNLCYRLTNKSSWVLVDRVG